MRKNAGGITISARLTPAHPRSPPRSVALRAEIGPLPARDRSYPAPRSVQFHVEVAACQDIWDRGGCFGWGGSRGWESCEAGWTAVGGSASVLMASVRRGWWVLHTRVHPASVGTAESCGTACRQRSRFCSHVRSPPLTARGSKTATHHDRQKIPSFQQKTTPVPQSPRPPMCNIEDNRTRQAHPPRPAPRSVHFRLEIGPAQPDQTDVEARTTSSRAKAICHTSEPSESSRPAEPNRSRCGVRPISARVMTDLDAELDRSRRGERPARFRPAIAPAQPGRPDVEARTTSSGAKATCRTSEPSASSRSAAARPISRMGT